MRRLLLWCFILVGLFGLSLAQPGSQSIEAEKLKLEKDKFEYEKRQSNRNLIFGFVLTTLGGAYASWLLSTRTWHRQTRIDLYRKRFEEGTAFLDSFAKTVGRRYYLLQRYLWALGGRRFGTDRTDRKGLFRFSCSLELCVLGKSQQNQIAGR